jgi:hypothetical protein
MTRFREGLVKSHPIEFHEEPDGGTEGGPLRLLRGLFPVLDIIGITDSPFMGHSDFPTLHG